MLTSSAILPDWMAARAERDVIELAPDEAQAFGLFVALDTQWRRHPMTGTRLGLDYAVIPVTAAMLDIPMSPAMLADLRVMEAAAIGEMARRERRA
ncbi:DUF1799 domain-containing protein [Sphingomonas sp. CCH15-F11]|uniref:DUF1799 domain-containing protein n=1 Tax=Sphingomonas sp. CCH15-F11 TaxID=1768785 RepID=UPI000A6D5BDB|nr:DUF1799 domain-containing protein [Sphingomonas sp. CCH15-F11]